MCVVIYSYDNNNICDNIRSLCRSIETLEGMRAQWDQFGRGFEAFSIWISDKEKQLDPLKSSSAPLEHQISTVKVPGWGDVPQWASKKLWMKVSAE